MNNAKTSDLVGTKCVSLMEMLNLLPRETGLPFDIFVSEKVYSAINCPSLKVYDRSRSSTVSISTPISVLAGRPLTVCKWKALKGYIDLNRDALLKLWNDEISQMEYCVLQKPIGQKK